MLIKQAVRPMLEMNIYLQEINAKYQLKAIEPHLSENIVIEEKLIEHLSVGGANPSKLAVADQPPTILGPSLKLVKYFDIIDLELKHCKLGNEDVEVIALFLKLNPPLNSLVLDSNVFSDAGFSWVAKSLLENSNLLRLSILGCFSVQKSSLEELLNVIRDVNKNLCDFKFDVTESTA